MQMDAIAGEGILEITSMQDGHYIYIDIADSAYGERSPKKQCQIAVPGLQPQSGRWHKAFLKCYAHGF